MPHEQFLFLLHATRDLKRSLLVRSKASFLCAIALPVKPFNPNFVGGKFAALVDSLRNEGEGDNFPKLTLSKSQNL